MKIKHIKIKTQGDSIIVSALCKIRCIGEDTVYFKVNKQYKDFIYPDASPFAALLLVPSMKLGEDLIIEGSISEKLYENLQTFMDILVSWNIGFKPIKIKVKKLIKDTQQPRYIGSFFSGGVDSFYTYLKNKPYPKRRISHLILVNGYDIELSNKTLWRKTRKHVSEIARQEHVHVIEIESNIQLLLEPIVTWEFTFGSCLAAIALLLRNKLRTVYIASSFTYEQQFPSGSTVTTDKYWGTEALTIIHDGAESTRLEKVKKISQYQLALDNLRVCYLNCKGIYNCGKCDKCLRTMISLFAAGKLHKAKTLPRTIDIELVKKISLDNVKTAVFHEENLKELKKLGKAAELQKVIASFLKKAKNNQAEFSFHRALIARAVYLDHMYIKGKLYSIYSKRKSFHIFNALHKYIHDNSRLSMDHSSTT